MKRLMLLGVVLTGLVVLFIFGRNTKLYKKLKGYLYGNKYGSKTKPVVKKAEKAATKIVDSIVNVKVKMGDLWGTEQDIRCEKHGRNAINKHLKKSDKPDISIKTK